MGFAHRRSAPEPVTCAPHSPHACGHHVSTANMFPTVSNCLQYACPGSLPHCFTTQRNVPHSGHNQYSSSDQGNIPPAYPTTEPTHGVDGKHPDYDCRHSQLYAERAHNLETHCLQMWTTSPARRSPRRQRALSEAKTPSEASHVDKQGGGCSTRSAAESRRERSEQAAHTSERREP